MSLLDVAPEIAPAFPEENRDKAWVQVCRNLRIQIGNIETPLPATFEGGKFLVDLEQLGARPWQDRLTIFMREAINAGWIAGDAERIAGDIVQRNYVRRRAAVAGKATLEERLLAAVGGTLGAFLATFDDAVRRAVELKAGLDPLGVARLALVTLRLEVEVGPGGLKDGFVMVSGLGPSWSASGVATLRWRLAGRAG